MDYTLVHYTLVDYTLMDYTLVHYTLMDYTLVHYTLVDYTLMDYTFMDHTLMDYIQRLQIATLAVAHSPEAPDQYTYTLRHHRVISEMARETRDFLLDMDCKKNVKNVFLLQPSMVGHVHTLSIWKRPLDTSVIY